MRVIHVLPSAMAAVAALTLAACSGGSGSGGSSVGGSVQSTQSGYFPSSLVSDGAAGITAAHKDSNLVNPWGIAFEPAGPVWIANNGTQTSTLYDGTGTAQALIVTVPNGLNGAADPTGIVYNGSGSFVVSGGGKSGAAQFIYDGEGGTVSGWAPNVGNTTVIAYDDGAGGAVYKGLAIASTGGGNFLYAADFHNNKVDVFNGSFQKVAMPGGFKDSSLPAGYAPFGIQNLGGKIYVAYAQQQGPANHDEVDGAGLGLVDVFDTSGNLLGGQHFIGTGGALNAPWGLALAPADFGSFSNDLLVGNFGDGKINAYDPNTGAFKGTLGDVNGKAIVIDGLWGIGFGNDAASQPHNTLFFAAGTNGEADGTYGRIDTRTVTSGGGSSSGGCMGYGC